MRLIEFMRYTIASIRLLLIHRMQSRIDHMKVINDMTRNAKTIEFPIVLKSIISHTLRDDKTFTKNDKQIRATLRAKLADKHVKNTSWIATNMREYDAIRRAYDMRYDASMINANKRASKRDAKTNVDNVADVDA
jgi:hypothetical protein